MDLFKKNKKVAIYNGFAFHYEMLGYLLYYFLDKNFEIVVYCNLKESNGYVELFHYFFGNYNFEYRCLSLFESQKSYYDLFILVTDDDLSFSTDNEEINDKTIRIDHSILVRRTEIKKCIATRPFFNGLVRPWALPCYPLISLQNRLEIIKNNETYEKHILILGNDHMYHTPIINRLYSEKPIILHAISRDMNESRFSKLKDNITLKIYKNIHALELFKIATKCNYILTDIFINPNYENKKMSGSIPFSFSILVPLIISKQTNSHYQFNNVIEFDKYSDEPILLKNMNEDFFVNLEIERKKLINVFFKIMEYYCSQL
jgi:hypothetical protein